MKTILKAFAIVMLISASQAYADLGQAVSNVVTGATNAVRDVTTGTVNAVRDVTGTQPVGDAAPLEAEGQHPVIVPVDGNTPSQDIVEPSIAE